MRSCLTEPRLQESNTRVNRFGLIYSHRHVIPAKEQVLIHTDLILVPTQGHYIRIASKSGLALKYGLTVEGGVVDPDYRGNVGVLLRNHSDQAQILEEGEAIAQVIMEKAAMPVVVEMKISKDTQRGTGGFGSTTE